MSNSYPVRRCTTLLVTVLSLSLGAPACQTQAPAGKPQAFESRGAAFEVGGRPGPRWVVRTRGDEQSIRQFAVAGGYVYFTARWDGIYRAALEGGAVGQVETVEVAGGTLFEEVAAAGDDVWWSADTFDENDYPHIRLRQQRAGGKSSRTVWEGDWARVSSNSAAQFQADWQGVYLNLEPRGSAGTSAIQAVSGGTGRLHEMLAVANLFEMPSWAVDVTHLYFAGCGRQGTGPCPLRRVTKQGGPIETVAQLPTPEVAVRAADDSGIYLTDANTVWQVPKRPGASPIPLHTADGGNIGWHLLADQRHVYFLEGDGRAGTRLRYVAKAGGPPGVLGEADVGQVDQLAQDATTIYMLRAWKEIVALPKP